MPLILTVPWVGLRSLIVEFSGHIHLLCHVCSLQWLFIFDNIRRNVRYKYNKNIEQNQLQHMKC